MAMRHLILKQFIPGNDQIWVAKLNPDDTEYIYDTLEEAEIKKAELEAADPGRGYKIVGIDAENQQVSL